MQIRLPAVFFLFVSMSLSGCCFWGPSIKNTELQWAKTNLFASNRETADNACTAQLKEVFERCKQTPGAHYSNHAGGIVSPSSCWEPAYDQCMKEHGWEQREVTIKTCPGMKLF
ncbi:MAG TPA: hypothetical protein VNZ27_03135 [Rhodanobacter sp.]|jgi:hypothetical protein|nr:hypothetical protein [Rhodanobacter sp.]